MRTGSNLEVKVRNDAGLDVCTSHSSAKVIERQMSLALSVCKLEALRPSLLVDLARGFVKTQPEVPDLLG